MFERFTNRARHVVVLAQEEARRLQHNYIGTEHILLGLLGEPDGVAGRVLQRFEVSLDVARDDVLEIIGRGKSTPSGHIPFTPRAKKVLELALREALQLSHNYIGTEHILLGLIREGDGVAAQVMKRHGDLVAIRMAVLDAVPSGRARTIEGTRWLRRRVFLRNTAEQWPAPAGQGEPAEQAEQAVFSASPAADTTLAEAARLAGLQPVGSHHLLLAALADANTAAARALTALGLDLDAARKALRGVDVTGTSDEQPEEAGRRQMVVRVTDDRLTLEASDPQIVKAGQAALRALGDQADPPGTIRGDLAAAASLASVWLALQESLSVILQRATVAGEPPDNPDKPDGPGNEAA